MPLPSPRSDESKQQWINRCMSSDTMQSEFESQDQRYAVCISKWTRYNSDSMFTDSVQIADGSMRRTEDGYLAATALVARGGNVQRYTGAEMGVSQNEMDVFVGPGATHVDVYRPEDEVFTSETMQSFAHRPLTNDHPSESVTADNWREYAVGYSGDEVARDGDYVRVPLLLTDADTITDMESGKRELSMGYQSEIEWADGTTPDGKHYDAIQRKIRNNHIALVDNARAGHKARIGDRHTPSTTTVPTQPEGRRMPDLKTVVVDGLTVETSAQGAEAIGKLQKQVSDAEAKQAELESTHEKALADKDKTIAERDAKLDELNKQVMTDEQLDEAVKERADLVAKAKSISDADYAGKSPAEIRKAAVVAHLGDEAVNDKSDAYIEARFDVLAEDADKADPVRGAIADSAPAKDDPQAEYERQLQDGYKEASNG